MSTTQNQANEEIIVGNEPIATEIVKDKEIWQAGITTLKLVWDGTDLSVDYGFMSNEDNAKRKTETRENGIFHLITQIDDTALKTLQAEIIKVLEFNRVKKMLTKQLSILGPEQTVAFDIVVPYIADPNRLTQLVLLISGHAKSGKSHLAQIICKYTYLLHGKPNGRYATVVLDNNSRALCLLLKPTLSAGMMLSLREHLKCTALIILEDCHFLSLEAIAQISSRLGEVTGKHAAAFGGFNTILVGDVQAMVNIKGTPIMQHDTPVSSKAIAGNKLLTEQLTHFVDLSYPSHPVIDFTGTASKSRVLGESFHVVSTTTAKKCTASMRHEDTYPAFVRRCLSKASHANPVSELEMVFTQL
jgi:hypothetical protein